MQAVFASRRWLNSSQPRWAGKSQPGFIRTKDYIVGNWGPGNFDNDAARDHLFDLTRGLADDVDQALDAATALKLSGPAFEADWAQLAEQLEVVLPNIEILCVLHEMLEGGFLPEPSSVEEWQVRFEQLSPDCSSAGTDISPERRAVIEATFARLLQLARQCWDE